MPVLHPGVLWPRHYWIPSIQWLCCGHCFKIIQLLLDAVTLFTMFTEKWRGTTHLFHTGEFFTQQFFAHSKILGKSSKLAFQDTSVNKFHTSLQMLFLFFIRHFSPALVCMKFCPQKKTAGEPCGHSCTYIFTKRVRRSVESSLQYGCHPMKPNETELCILIRPCE